MFDSLSPIQLRTLLCDFRLPPLRISVITSFVPFRDRRLGFVSGSSTNLLPELVCHSDYEDGFSPLDSNTTGHVVISVCARSRDIFTRL